MKKHIFLPDSLKIVLVQLNDKSVYAGYKRNLTKRKPLGLAYIAASLISAGHSVEIVDAALDDLGVNQIIKTTLDKTPHLVGITATTPLFPQLVEVIQGLKNRNKDIYFFIGGPHASSLPELSLVSSEADCVCIGGGEHSIVELIDNLIQNKEPSSVQSIMYRWNGEIKATKTMRMKFWHAKAMPAPPDLDSISFPARQILRLNEYVDYARGVLSPQTSFITARGCVGSTFFASFEGESSFPARNAGAGGVARAPFPMKEIAPKSNE